MKRERERERERVLVILEFFPNLISCVDNKFDLKNKIYLTWKYS